MIREQAPAKVNLSLHITGRREDGYHLMHMVNFSVPALSDTLVFEPAPDLSLSCSDPGVPAGEDNLVYRAMVRLKEACGADRGARVRLEKHIPMQAGLAGGSSDAAAVLRGLNRLWELALSEDQLIELAADIGADVPYCLVSRPAVVTGIGEKIEKLGTFPSFAILGVKPPVSISTPEAFRQMDRIQRHRPYNDTALRAALDAGDFAGLSRCCGNDFEKIVFPKSPMVAHIGEQMRKAGAWMARMSGSGSTMIGYFKTTEQAEGAAALFKSQPSIVFTAEV
ncbi:MAG: 4-(cytidine 5'-diphospho)-2-C-methyl-D-erythritol kinase [Pseudoramibacter sp.]